MRHRSVVLVGQQGRRCSWCARRLRWWQWDFYMPSVSYCRTCARAMNLAWQGPPCGMGDRHDAKPDTLLGYFTNL